MVRTTIDCLFEKRADTHMKMLDEENSGLFTANKNRKKTYARWLFEIGN